MAQKTGFRSVSNETYQYTESSGGNSIAFGFDSGSGTFNINAAATPNVTPDEATSYLAIDPTTGEMVIQADVGQLLTVNSEVKFAEAQIVNITTVDAANPYVVADTDYFLRVRTNVDAFTIQLPDAPPVGRVIVVKDPDGNALSSNITVTTVSGGFNIDGDLTFVMNTNWQAAQFIYDGAEYKVF